MTNNTKEDEFFYRLGECLRELWEAAKFFAAVLLLILVPMMFFAAVVLNEGDITEWMK